ADMKAGVANSKDKASGIKEEDRLQVWAEVSPPPDIFTTGSGTFMNEMLEMIHAENIAADEEGWVKFSPEAVVKQNPDVIVLTYYIDDGIENVLARDGWQNISAVANEKVYNVDSDLVSRAGPRLVKGVQELAENIYPDVFKD